MKKPVPVYSLAPVSGGVSVYRNDLPMKTPQGIDLVVPNQRLATALRDEWQAQGKKVIPGTMPMTQLAMTTLDITTAQRDRTIAELMAYLDSELLCHRVADPEALVLRQHKIWQPFLDWIQALLGAALTIGTGIMPIRQSPEAAEGMRRIIDGYDNWRLTGLRYAVDSCGSLVLGLALAEFHTAADQIADAADLDATFQMEKWGQDPAIIERRAAMYRDLDEAAHWFALLSPPSE